MWGKPVSDEREQRLLGLAKTGDREALMSYALMQCAKGEHEAVAKSPAAPESRTSKWLKGLTVYLHHAVCIWCEREWYKRSFVQGKVMTITQEAIERDSTQDIINRVEQLRLGLTPLGASGKDTLGLYSG
jgi:hypothetical protein